MTASPSPRRTAFSSIDLDKPGKHIGWIMLPCHPNGQTVHAGEAAGRIHRIWEPTQEPVTLYYQTDGILYGRRHPGRVQPGNCCLVVASAYTGPF